ncbi:TPA: flavin reductase family protein [Serratia marcescens]
MTGVTIVTSVDKQGRPIGFTANSFSSVSLDPALLLVSIDKRSANLAHFTQCSHFAINILAEQQKEASTIFAQKNEDRFALIDWRWSASRVPLIDNSSAWFDCCKYLTKVIQKVYRGLSGIARYLMGGNPVIPGLLAKK